MTSEQGAVSITLAFGPELPVQVGDVLPFKDERGELLCMVRVKSINFGEGDQIDIGLEVVQE